MVKTSFQTPSLFGAVGPGAVGRADPHPSLANAAPQDSTSLVDLLYDGFYMIFMLRNRATPLEADAFRARVKDFLIEFERHARRLPAEREEIHLAKFAFSALVDEVVLMSQSRLRDSWERLPLQLELFGEQLAGERFFEHLETLRASGAARLPLLEVFHMCLLMGFQGKYIVEGSEKLGYLTGRVGDEIAHHKGKRLGFAPHWAAPDRVAHALRSEVPVWVVGSVFALLGLIGFLGVRHALQRQTASDLAGYTEVVKLAPQPAYVILTLP